MTPKEENKKLRELLWLNHGHQGIYGDNGELHCMECGGIDFKRDSIEIIERVFNERAMKRYGEWALKNKKITLSEFKRLRKKANIDIEKYVFRERYGKEE